MENYRNLDHTMREFHEIEAMWKEVGITPDKHNAFYCGTGIPNRIQSPRETWNRLLWIIQKNESKKSYAQSWQRYPSFLHHSRVVFCHKINIKHVFYEECGSKLFEEITTFPFLDTIGLRSHLSPLRANGLVAILKRIQQGSKTQHQQNNNRRTAT